MGLFRAVDGSDPVRGDRLARLDGEHRLAASRPIAVGTLACPRCDAPVSPGKLPLSPAAPLACPFCAHDGAVRDFLSLSAPTRPARVVVRLRLGEPLRR